MPSIAFARQAEICQRHTITLETEKHEKVNIARLLEATQKEYSGMVEFLTKVCAEDWDEINRHSQAKQQKTAIEKLVHATKKNPNPKHDFDGAYPNAPAYLRRSAIAHALSAYKSWHSNHENWLQSNPSERGAEPTLTIKRNLSPTCYRDGTYIKAKGRWVKLKLYNGKTWQWCTVPLAPHDFKQVTKYHQVSGADISAPTITKRGRKWCLTYLVTIPGPQYRDEKPTNARICGVDLGVNTAATLVVMDADGTVIARKFVKLAREEDRLRRALGRLRKRQSMGSTKNRRFWDYIKNLNHQLSVETAKAIVAFAEEHECSTIACEFLSFSGKTRGSRKQRLSVWRKREVYDLMRSAAGKLGIHVHQVCAWGTSKLAHDGSGEVLRGRDIVDASGASLGLGYGWVEFASGKLYNADLNAALNIAARGFIALYQKASSVRKWSRLVAKVPELARRTQCTLSTLINLRAVLS